MSVDDLRCRSAASDHTLDLIGITMSGGRQTLSVSTGMLAMTTATQRAITGVGSHGDIVTLVVNHRWCIGGGQDVHESVGFRVTSFVGQDEINLGTVLR